MLLLACFLPLSAAEMKKQVVAFISAYLLNVN